MLHHSCMPCIFSIHCQTSYVIMCARWQLYNINMTQLTLAYSSVLTVLKACFAVTFKRADIISTHLEASFKAVVQCYVKAFIYICVQIEVQLLFQHEFSQFSKVHNYNISNCYIVNGYIYYKLTLAQITGCISFIAEWTFTGKGSRGQVNTNLIIRAIMCTIVTLINVY